MASPAEAWAWKHRVLVVFAPDGRDDSLAEQRQQLKGTKRDLTERHMAVVEIVGGKAKTVLGAELEISGPELAAFLRKDDDSFEVLMLGKDTGIKLRSREPVSANEVFALIDTMPMRRQEMKKQGG